MDRNQKAKEMGSNIQIAYKQQKNIKKIVGGPAVRGEWKMMLGAKNARKTAMLAKF